MLHLLWDASEIWGPLAEWGVRSMGLPCRVVCAADVASGILAREHPAMLLVPGGFARQKAAALGGAGLEAVRAYVAGGGQYLGFCGGAGLALSGDGGLGLCPWGRAGYASREQHYISGHFFATAFTHSLTPPDLPEKPLLPVWWPGRFAPKGEEKAELDPVAVLAAYAGPGPDLLLGDQPCGTSGAGASFSLAHGEPCLIHGAYGKGGYTLGYTHLETPDSPDANRWLAHLVRRLGGFAPQKECISAWKVAELPLVWDDPDLTAMRDALAGVLSAGLDTGIFFERTPWLTGWRPGLPGMALNTLRALLCTALSLPPCPAARRLWHEQRKTFMPRFQIFIAHQAKESASDLLPLMEELVYLQLQRCLP